MSKPLLAKNYSLQTGDAGFTLIEILVSIVIFGLVLTATISILVSNISTSTSVRNNYIASGLAQEGMEVVRNIRDAGWFAGAPFDTLLPDGTYRVQWNSSAFLAAGSNPLLEDGATGIFSYDSGGVTLFSRSVVVSTVVPSAEKKIVVTVSWNERGLAKTLSAEDHLFNWR